MQQLSPVVERFRLDPRISVVQTIVVRDTRENSKSVGDSRWPRFPEQSVPNSRGLYLSTLRAVPDCVACVVQAVETLAFTAVAFGRELCEGLSTARVHK